MPMSPEDEKSGRYSPPTSDFVTAYHGDEKSNDEAVDSNQNINPTPNDGEESLDEL